MHRIMHAAIAIAAAATAANAQVPGDLVFVTDSGTVQWVPLAGGAGTNIATFSSDTTVDRLLDVEFGPNHDLLVSSGPFPVGNPSSARLIQISDPFGAANASDLISSDPLGNPLGVAYDPSNGLAYLMENPGSQPPVPNGSEGVFTVDTSNASITQTFTAVPTPDPGQYPLFQAGGGVELDPNNAGNLIVSAIEGGAFNYPSNNPNGGRGASLHRLVPAGGGNFNETLIVDLSDTSVTGLTNAIGRTTGIAPVGDSIFIGGWEFLPSSSDPGIGRLYRVDLDVNGDFAGITEIAGPGNLPFTIFPEEIEYNPISDTLVFTSRSASNPGIYEIGLDGTGFRTVFNGELTRGIAVFVPTPATGLILAGAGLVAIRRRR